MNPRLKFKREDAPLFDFARAKEAAERKRDASMAQVSQGAENLASGFKERALAHVERFARTHESFLCEDLRAAFSGDSDVNTKAWGPVLKMAEARGIVEADGYGMANCSNRSPRVRWKSKLCGGGS